MSDRETRLTLADVAEVTVGGTPSTKEPTLWGGDVAWATPTDITACWKSVLSTTARTITKAGLDRCSARVVRSGSTLVTTRATIGPAAMAGRAMAMNQGVTALSAREGIDDRWLYYWVLANRYEFVRRGAGNTFPEISRSKTRAIPILVPSLAEQLRVADLLAAHDRVLDASRAAIEALRVARYRCLHEAFGPVTAEGHGAVPLGDFLSLSIGGVWGELPGVAECDASVVRSTNFDNEGGLSLDSGAARSVTAKQLASRELQPHDVLLEKSGGGPDQPVGRVVRMTQAVLGIVPSNFVQLVRPDDDLVDPRWLFWLLFYWHASSDTLRFQNQTTGIRNLRTRDYLNRPITRPGRLEQQAIAFACDALAAELSALRSHDAATSELMQSVMSKLFADRYHLPTEYDRFLDREPVPQR